MWINIQQTIVKIPPGPYSNKVNQNHDKQWGYHCYHVQGKILETRKMKFCNYGANVINIPEHVHAQQN